jgi:hypothetical protein
MPDHPHTIDRWDDATGENLVEQIAAVGDYLVALATYKAAVKRWPKDKITLRNRARSHRAELGAGLARRVVPFARLHCPVEDHILLEWQSRPLVIKKLEPTGD